MSFHSTLSCHYLLSLSWYSTAHYHYPPPLSWCFTVHYQTDATTLSWCSIICYQTSTATIRMLPCTLLVPATTISVCWKPKYLSFLLSNAVVETVRVQINTILFIFFEDDIRTFKIRITAWCKHNQYWWHSFLRFSTDCMWYPLYTMCIFSTSWIINS